MVRMGFIMLKVMIIFEVTSMQEHQLNKAKPMQFAN